MAKNKTTLVCKEQAKKQPAKKRRNAKVKKQALDVHAMAHARMLADPCNADLAPTVYTGDRGYMNRFVNNYSAGVTTGQTAWCIIVKPGNQVAHLSADTTSATATILTYSTTNFAGNVFLAANSSKARTAGYCVDVRPFSSPNTVTGTIHFGIVNAQSLAAGTSITYDNLTQYCTDSVSASQALMAPLSVKWSPGSFDDRYSPYGSLADDDSDRNVILIVGIGFPAATGAQLRCVSIVEWAPLKGLGAVNDATSVRYSTFDKDAVLQYLKSKDSSWWWSIGTRGLRFIKAASTFYAGGAIGAMPAPRLMY